MSTLVDRIFAALDRRPSIGVVGIASWDTLLVVEQFPNPGGFAMVSTSLELPGGTSANAAAAAAKLGAAVELISAVGDDPTGARLLEALSAAGIDCSRVKLDPSTPTDQTTVVTSSYPADRTIFWREGAIPRRGDPMNIDRLFTRDLVLLDSVDWQLRRFLIDLPVHTYPNVKLLVPLTYIVDFPGPDELASVMRADALVGSARELQHLTGTQTLMSAIDAMQALMKVTNLRSVAITLGEQGAVAFDEQRIYRVPPIDVDVVDTTGAGDAFAGAFGVGLACRLDLPDALALANCVAGHAVESLGAQTGHPSLTQVVESLKIYPAPMPS